MDYIELTVELSPRMPWADILVAELAELGFESFVETEKGIQAYAPISLGEHDWISQTSLFGQPLVDTKVTSAIIEHQNWNAQWEADFEPVLVDDRLVILAPFHNASAFSQERKIIIQPQMSFGTGHHQTTFLMSQLLMDLPTVPNEVLDMGAGTGVLAILAEMLGATKILAVDIEPWSVENTIENAQRNNCTQIHSIEGDIPVTFGSKFGLILANINKNVLKAHLPHYADLLHPGGILFLSGFFASDVAELTACANALGLTVSEVREKETWAAIKLEK